MKLLTTFLVLSLSIILSPKLSSQTCLPEGIIFTTQTGINNFPSNYPGCQVIIGDVVIDDMEISTVTNVDSLIYLTEIQGNLHIGTQYATPYFNSLEGLSNLSSIGGDLDIGGNFDLYSLTGLESLITIGGQLNIHNNNFLSNLQGLDNLTSVESVSIVSNSSLTSLTGIDSIDYSLLTSLTISYNDALTMCNVYSICNYINSDDPTVTIYNNETGCDSQTQVQEQCLTSINNYLANDIYMVLYPNPVKSTLVLTFDDNLSPIFKYSIFSVNGQTLISNTNYQSQTEIEVSLLSSGMYILEVEFDNGGSAKRRFIKN